MVIGDRLRELRETTNLSQGDIEKRTGLLRCYVSRVENGHTVPNIETLEKLAAAFEVPLWKIFYEGSVPAHPLIRSHVIRRVSTLISEGSEVLSETSSASRPHERKRSPFAVLCSPEDGASPTRA